jgi:hypothetical protein
MSASVQRLATGLVAIPQHFVDSLTAIERTAM